MCEFAILHHLRRPQLAIAEMLRVSSKAIFSSDSNTFGSGSILARSAKQLINACGMWKMANFGKTKGKVCTVSECDGVAYSYSVFDNYAQIAAQCRSMHLLNTKPGGYNPYRTASHVALLGIKK